MTTAERIKSVKFQEAKALVRDKLATDPAWLVRGLVCLYNRQTADEQRADDTKHRNTVGFNSADARVLTSLAKTWLRDNWLSDNQMGLARRLMAKYAGQLARVARSEEVAEPAGE